jgi:hypothetical protein
MTSAAFSHARGDGVVLIEPDIDAMRYIATEIDLVDDAHALPNLMLVGRDGGRRRSLISRWDYRLPRYSSEPVDELFLSARELGVDQPATVDHERLAALAQEVGATAFTEITLQGWDPRSRRTHAAAYVTGLLLGQRPLRPGPPSHLAEIVARTFAGAFGDERHRLSLINAIQRRRDDMPEPFIVTYGRHAIPE